MKAQPTRARLPLSPRIGASPMHPAIDALALLSALELADGCPVDDYARGFIWASTAERADLSAPTALYALGVRDAHMLECERWDEAAC